MPSTIFSGSKVKALKDRFSLNDVTEIISVSADPTSGGGISAPLGSIAMDYLAGKVYKKTGSLATEWQELGAGLGGINYIENPDAESGTTGWSTYADAAGSQPVDGTGGSPNITWSRSTTTPLRGVADFNLVKDAVNRQGQGVSYDFTIDPADQAKVLTVAFDYEVLSGTYATGDLAVYLIQDPAGTPVVIQPAGFQVQAGTIGTKLREIATFQTANTGQSYRLCIHVASTSASAYTLAIDNVSVGPQVVQYGAPVTDWQAYTPTFTGFGTPSGVEVFYRRVGDKLELKGRFLSGTSTATEARMSLPAGLSAAGTDKIPSLTIAGVGGYTVATTSIPYVLSEPSVAYVTFGAQTATSASITKANGNPFLSSGQGISFTAQLPILGWSSTVQMSNDTDTRVVAASASRNSGAATYSPTAPFDFNTVAFDTHGALTTGASWKFTAPVPGYYNVAIAGTYATATTGAACQLYKNGSIYQDLLNYNDVAGYRAAGSVVLYLTVGDYVDIRPGASAVYMPGMIAINRLSGPSAIAASETVAASYYLNANQAVTANVTPINFNTKIFDTHGSVTTGASWRFTAPVAGKYDFVTVQYAGASAFDVMVYKNGSVLMGGTGAISGIVGTAINTIDLLAGDYIEFRSNASVTIQGGLLTSSTTGKVHIKRVGN